MNDKRQSRSEEQGAAKDSGADQPAQESGAGPHGSSLAESPADASPKRSKLPIRIPSSPILTFPATHSHGRQTHDLETAKVLLGIRGQMDEPLASRGVSQDKTESGHHAPNDGPIRVLLVEDNLPDERLLRALLEKGYPGQFWVEVATSLGAAKVAVSQPDFEAILLDLSLPDSQGIETIERLVQSAGSIPIVVLSGLDDEDVAAEAVRRGAQDYLRKGCTDASSVAKAIRYAIDRKQTEVALKESEKKYRTLFAEMLNGFALHEIICDSTGQPADYVTIEVNAAFESLLDVPGMAVIGRKASELLPPGELCHWLDIFGPVALTGKSAHYETYSPSTKKHFEGTAYSPERGKFAVTFADVTRRKQGEEVLRQREEALKKAQQVAHVGSWAWHIQTDRLEWSDEMYRIFGVDKTEFIGDLKDVIAKAIHPEDRAKVEESNLRVIHEKKPVPLEYRVVWPDQTIRVVWAEAGELILDENGNASVLTGIVQDITDRKQAELSLRESEEKYRSLFDHVPIGIFKSTVDGKVEYVNSAYARIFGHDSPEEAVAWVNQKGVAEATYMTPADRQRFVEQVMTAGNWQQFENRYRRKDGSELIGDLVFTTKEEPNGRISLTGFVEDITKRKRTEQALRDSEQRYRSLVENVGLGVVLVGTDYRILSVNAAQAKLFGKAPEELVGKECFREFEKRDSICPNCPGKLAMEAGQPAEMERQGIRGDGRTHLARVQAFPLQDSSGRPTGFIEVTEDITKRKQAEQAFGEVRDRLDLSMRSARMGAFEWDIVSNKRYWDATVHLLLGTSPETFSGTPEGFLGIVHPDDRQGVQDDLNKALGGENYETSYRVILADGSIRHIAARGRIYRDDAGRPIRMVGICWDITDRKQAEEEKQRLEAQYRQAQKMEAVGRLAAGVAHDFNNQLTIIQGYADLFLSEGREDDPQWEPMTQIRQAARRAHSTTSHLLSFSRKQVLQAEVIDLGEFLTEAQKPISRMIGEDIKLVVTALPNLPAVLIDKSGLHQALMNLIVNARDAMPGGGELILRASAFRLAAADEEGFPNASPGNYVLLEVIDFGVGMAPQTLELAVEPFFTTKEIGKGTGLGLPMVKGFVEQSGGFMSIRSEVGKGTTVRLLLPVAPRKISVDKPSVSDRAKAVPGTTLLVVEDEAGVCEYVAAVLTRSGYRVLAAAGPMEALELSEEHDGPIDLLITDIIMPAMRGDEMARQLKVSRRELQVLFVTGYADEHTQREGTILRKPFEVNALLDRVGFLLNQRQTRR